ncbi:MAG: gfo/Idh/MocA family oxidoreductase, partial [Clostridia bacterium]|nr:gfo/Idh/MocA family oxidoreductase [Clostridia bacterium]
VPGVDELEISDVSTGGKYVSVPIPDEFRVDQMQAFADLLNGRGDGLDATVDDGVANEILLDGILRADAERRWVTL